MIEESNSQPGAEEAEKTTMALGPDGKPLTEAEEALQKEMSDPENVNRMVDNIIAINLPTIWDMAKLTGFAGLTYQLSEHLTPEQREVISKKINSAVDARAAVVRDAENAAKLVISRLKNNVDYPEYQSDLAALPEEFQQKIIRARQETIEMQ